MAAVTAAMRRHYTTLPSSAADELRTIIIERGENHASALLGCSRHVLVRACALLPISVCDRAAIFEGLKAVAS
jgi:hypothetical protein